MSQQKIFGLPINFNGDATEVGANDLIGQHLDIKAKYKGVLKEATCLNARNVDHDAHRFFCEDDCVHFFSKKHLQSLMSLLKNDDDCLVLHHGCVKDENGHFGKPTLIASAYTMSEDKKTLHHKPIHIASNDGKNGTFDALEYAGAGRAIQFITKNDSGKHQISKELDVSKIC